MMCFRSRSAGQSATCTLSGIQKIGAGVWAPTIMSLSRSPMTEVEEMDDRPEADWTLADVYENPEWKDKVQIMYEYDMG